MHVTLDLWFMNSMNLLDFICLFLEMHPVIGVLNPPIEAVTIDGVKMATEEPFKTANEMAPWSERHNRIRDHNMVSILGPRPICC